MNEKKYFKIEEQVQGTGTWISYAPLIHQDRFTAQKMFEKYVSNHIYYDSTYFRLIRVIETERIETKTDQFGKITTTIKRISETIIPTQLPPKNPKVDSWREKMNTGLMELIP